MFGEKTGCNHANAIVHVSGGIQFTHARIYQRITRFSFTPQPEMLFVVFPLDAVVFGFKSLCNRLRKFSPVSCAKRTNSRIDMVPNRRCKLRREVPFTEGMSRVSW